MVSHSYRKGSTQFFTFSDIFFPIWPPFLSGKWQGWIGNPSLDKEGRCFLQPDGTGGDTEFGRETYKLCRVIGTISANESMPGKKTDASPEDGPAEPIMVVYGNHAASWSEIEYMKGCL